MHALMLKVMSQTYQESSGLFHEQNVDFHEFFLFSVLFAYTGKLFVRKFF